MLGPRIAALRRSAGMSQAQLAEKLKISPSAVGMYEQGRREPGVDTLVAMSSVFEISTDYLLTGKPRTPDEERRAGQAMLCSLLAAEDKLDKRPERPFSRQELAILLSAVLDG